MELITHKLSNGKTVIGTVYSNGQLFAKFQLCARGFGLSDSESFACWISADNEKKTMHFGSIERADSLAFAGFAKLENVEIPDLSEI